MQIPISVSWGDPKLEFRLRFPVFQPIDALWDNNTGQEQNAGDEELICSARKRRFVRHAGNRPSHGQRKNRSRRYDAVAGAQTKKADAFLSMPQRTRYLIVDGHSIIFAWPELRKLHQRRSSLAREALVRQLQHYQDRTGVPVVIVFDGKGRRVDTSSDPGEVQVIYSRHGQTADAIIERLASKYAERFDLTVATSDLGEAETVHACGAEWMSPNSLRELLEQMRR